MESIEERIERIIQAQCWYPLGDCNRTANDSILEHGKDIGYCKAHAKEMRQRYEAEVSGPIDERSNIRRATMKELITDIGTSLLMTIGGKAVQDLKLEEWDEEEYMSLSDDFCITLDMAKEAFPKALAQAKKTATRLGY